LRFDGIKWSKSKKTKGEMKGSGKSKDQYMMNGLKHREKMRE